MFYQGDIFGFFPCRACCLFDKIEGQGSGAFATGRIIFIVEAHTEDLCNVVRTY